MRADLFVYLSGPMTARDGVTFEANVAAGVEVFLACLARGIPAFSPHLCGLIPEAWSAVGYAQWLAYDCAVIDRCTHVLMLPRWEDSAGARHEHAYAIAQGKPVLHAIADLPGVAVAS
jgi:hypothetical protein